MQHQQSQGQPLPPILHPQQLPPQQPFQVPQLQQHVPQSPAQQQQQQQPLPPRIPQLQLQPHQQRHPPHLNLPQLQSLAPQQQPSTPQQQSGPQRSSGYSRKDKSLGLLCDNFLATYVHLSPGQGEVCLDEAATRLEVERRRIYDIVNVLESVDVVTRRQKNSYTWNGLDGLGATLQRLGAAASPAAPSPSRSATTEVTEQTGGDSMSWAPGAGGTMTAANSVGNLAGQQGNHGSDDDSPPRTAVRYVRKDKSLSVLSQRFIQMFLAANSPVVGLDDAAAALLGGNAPDVSDAKLKTKVRRLYDIANVLSSLQLLEKTQLPDTRKPAFRWKGPPAASEIADHLKAIGAGPNRQSEGGTSEGSFAGESPAAKRESELANGHRGGKRMRAQQGGRGAAARGGLPLSRGAHGSGSYSPPETPGIPMGLATGAMPSPVRHSMVQAIARSITPGSAGPENAASPHSATDSQTGPQLLAMAAAAASAAAGLPPPVPPFLPVPAGFPPAGMPPMPLIPGFPPLPGAGMQPFPMSFPMAMQQMPGFPASSSPSGNLLPSMPPLPAGSSAADHAASAQVWATYMQFYQTWLAWQQQQQQQQPRQQQQQQTNLLPGAQPGNAIRQGDGQPSHQQQQQQQDMQRANSQQQLPQQHAGNPSASQFGPPMQGSQTQHQQQSQQQLPQALAPPQQQPSLAAIGSSGADAPMMQHLPADAAQAPAVSAVATAGALSDTAMLDAEVPAATTTMVGAGPMTQMLQGITVAAGPPRPVMQSSGALAAAREVFLRRTSGTVSAAAAPDQLPVGVLVPATLPGGPATTPSQVTGS